MAMMMVQNKVCAEVRFNHAKARSANSPEARVADKVVSDAPVTTLGGYSAKITDKVSIDAIQTRSLALIEDEFRAEIAQALGKSEHRLLSYMKEMRIAEVHFNTAKEMNNRQALKEAVDILNAAIDRADQGLRYFSLIIIQ